MLKDLFKKYSCFLSDSDGEFKGYFLEQDDFENAAKEYATYYAKLYLEQIQKKANFLGQITPEAFQKLISEIDLPKQI